MNVELVVDARQEEFDISDFIFDDSVAVEENINGFHSSQWAFLFNLLNECRLSYIQRFSRYGIK